MRVKPMKKQFWLVMAMALLIPTAGMSAAIPEDIHMTSEGYLYFEDNFKANETIQDGVAQSGGAMKLAALSVGQVGRAKQNKPPYFHEDPRG